MPRSYADLLSNDPAWPVLAKRLSDAPNGAVVLPPASDAARRACLEALQVTTRSTLGALAHETGGVLVDGGWLRLLGAGSSKMTRSLVAYNETIGVPVSEALIVADDVIGGVFALNGGALGESVGNVYYFAPDALEWEDTELGHSDFIGWALEGDLQHYYEEQRWDGWREEVSAMSPDQTFSLHPPLWSAEGKDVASVSRKAVPAHEVWALQQQFMTALDGAADE